MANSARIHTSGIMMYLLLDPSTGTLTQPATIDTDLLDNIVITASGGAVTVLEVEFEDKYPFVDLTNNQFKICFRLSRQIKFGETITVTIPASLTSDGTRTNATSTDLAVTNQSYSVDSVGELIGDTHRIVYVDPTLGNDTNAAAVNSNAGYYLKTDAEVGANPDSPDGAVVAYATIAAAMTVVPTGTPAMMLFKRGETFDGTTNFAAGQRILPERGGTSSNPFVFTAYGAGADPIFQPSAVGSEGSRVMNFRTGATDSYVWVSHLDMRVASNTSIDFNRLVGSDGLMQNIYFYRCTIDRVATTPDQTGTQVRLTERVVFDNCVGLNSNAESFMQGSSDFDDFTFREWSIINCVFSDVGGGILDHVAYPKSYSDLLFAHNTIDYCSGNGVKVDACWGVSIRDNLYTRCQMVAELNSNGEVAAGVQVDRTEDTETGEYPNIANADGSYSKWVTVKRNVITDMGNPLTNQVILVVMGQCYDSTVKDNLLYSEQDIISHGFIVRNEPGSSNGYTRDGWNNNILNNTCVFNATTTTGQRGIRFEIANNDDFLTTSTKSKGHHNLLIDRNVFLIGSGVTGSTRNALETDYDTWENGETAGRIDGNVTRNNVYRVGGSETNFYEDEGTALSTIAAFESALNQVTGSTASGNIFEDPGIIGIGEQVSDWAVDNGYTDLDDLVDTLAAGVIAGTMATIDIIDPASSYLRTQYEATNLNSADYGGLVAGILLESPSVAPEDTDDTGGTVRTLRPTIAPAAQLSPRLSVAGVRPALSIQNDSTTETTLSTIDISLGSSIIFDSVGSDYEIRYTTNNTVPKSTSKLYSGPIVINRNLTGSDNTIIKARIFHKNNPNIKSRTTKIKLRVV